jgi:colicin import membrane protein
VSSSYVPVESLLSSSAFRRLFGISLAAHIVVFLALVLRPPSNATLIASAPVMVTMVDMPKPVPAPPAAKPPAPPPPEEKPKPPEPEPPPPPPKPVVKEIVIPKEPAPLQKPKPVPKVPPPSADELIAKMTQKVEQQEAANAPPAPPAPSEAPADAQASLPSPGTFDPLFSPWIARVQVHVRSNWSGASVCEGKHMPVFNVDVDAGGHLTGIELSQSSGDSHCDDTGERALRKSDPLPAPPRPGQFELWLDAKVTP